MSANILWGEAKLAGSLQPLEDVDGAPLLTVDDEPIDTVYPELTLAELTTVDGEPIQTVDITPILAIVGSAAPPKYWQTANVTSDGGIAFAFLHKYGPWQPAAQGGENEFAWLFLTLSWSMAATIRVRAEVDGTRDEVELADGSTVAFVDSVFNLEQQGGTLQRKSAVFPVPLVRRQSRDGVPIAGWYLRGERLAFTVESTGPLGVGELMLEGAEVEFEPLRKAIYETVQS